MKKFSLIVSALLATTLMSTACTVSNKDSVVTSITIKGSKEVAVGQSITLTATVKVSDKSASKKVKWSSSDRKIATVSSSGVVKGVSAGTVEITATSVEDDTQSETVTITVVDAGFLPEAIEQGYTYSKTYPVQVIKTFLGNNSVSVPEPEDLTGGCYYQVFEEEDVEDEDTGELIHYPAQVYVLVDGVQYEEYYDARRSEGWSMGYFDDYYYSYILVDPSKTYVVSLSASYDEETYEDIAPTYLIYTKVEDYFSGSATKTTDVAWNKTEVVSAAHEYDSAAMESLIDYVPFVALGEDYDYSPMYQLTFFGYWPLPNTLEIADYSVNIDLLKSYGATLKGQGFSEITEEGVTYYEKGIDEFTNIDICYFWGQSGNTIDVMFSPKDLNAYPAQKITDFVKDNIETIYTVPAFTGTGSSYAYSESEYYDVDGTGAITGKYKTATVCVNETPLTTYSSFVNDLGLAGFIIEEDDYTASDVASYGYAQATAIKGNLQLDICYYGDELPEGEMDEDNEIYYSTTSGEIEIMICAANAEEKLVCFPKDSILLKVGASETVVAQPQIGEGTVSYTSSDPTVATVNASTGLINAISAGTTTVTASYVYESQTYTDTLEVTVKNLATGITISGADSVSGGKTATFKVSPTPADTILEGTVDWSIKETKESCYIDSVTGVLTTNSVAADETVTVCADCGTFHAEKVVTITAIALVTTETYTFKSADNTKTVGGTTITITQPKGASAPAFINGLRLYSNNYITFTAPEGVNITKIVFTPADYGSKSPAPITVSSGSYNQSTTTWTGSANSVSLTCGTGGQFRFTKVEITYDKGVAGDSGDDISELTMDTVEVLKPMVASYLKKDESSVTVSALNPDEDYTEDIAIFDYGTLTFASFYFEDGVKNCEDYISIIQGLLPSGALGDVDNEGYVEEYDCIDDWYYYEDFVLCFYVDGSDGIVWGTIDVVPADQISVYYAMMYQSF